MNEEVERYWELSQEYEERFGERFVLPVNSDLSTRDGIRIMEESLERNVPYEYPELPEDCLE